MTDPRPPDPRASIRPGVVALIAVAAPAVLGLETAARALLLPAPLALLRQEMRPTLTPIAWALLALTALSVPLAFWAWRALSRRLLAKVEAIGPAAPAADEKRRGEARFEAMFVATSIPQLPAILSTLLLTAGSDALPVLAAMGLSTAAVIAIGLSARAGAGH